jgi:hypothetical protein
MPSRYVKLTHQDPTLLISLSAPERPRRGKRGRSFPWLRPVANAKLYRTVSVVPVIRGGVRAWPKSV